MVSEEVSVTGKLFIVAFVKPVSHPDCLTLNVFSVFGHLFPFLLFCCRLIVCINNIDHDLEKPQNCCQHL